jgi:hypothetical protein
VPAAHHNNDGDAGLHTVLLHHFHGHVVRMQIVSLHRSHTDNIRRRTETRTTHRLLPWADRGLEYKHAIEHLRGRGARPRPLNTAGGGGNAHTLKGSRSMRHDWWPPYCPVLGITHGPPHAGHDKSLRRRVRRQGTHAPRCAPPTACAQCAGGTVCCPPPHPVSTPSRCSGLAAVAAPKNTRSITEQAKSRDAEAASATVRGPTTTRRQHCSRTAFRSQAKQSSTQHDTTRRQTPHGALL